MPSQKKVEIVKKLTEELKNSDTIIITDYQGLSCPQLENLRKNLKEVDTKFFIAKNTLIQIALSKLNLLNDTLKEILKGPCALATSERKTQPFKKLLDFAKTHQQPVIKGSFLENIFYDKQRSLQLATLPSKQELQAQIVSQIASPLHKMLSILTGNQQRLVYILNEIKNKRSNS